MTVTRGLSALREKSDQEFKENGGGKKSFLRPGFFNLKENETVVLRFVEEGYEWLGPKQHSFVKAKDKPANWQGNWNETVSAVCRYDDIIGADSCYICDNKVENSWGKPSVPVRKIYTIAQLREEVRGDGSNELGGPENEGKLLFYAPKLIEVDETDDDGNLTGEKVLFPEFVIINQGIDAFAGPLEIYLNDFETLCDRDYRVTRIGTGVKTKYEFNPVMKDRQLFRDEDFLPGTEDWDAFVTEPLKKMGVDLLRDLQRRGSEEHYAMYIDPTQEPPARNSDKKSNSGGSGTSSGRTSSAPKNPSATPANLASAKERLKAYRTKG